MTSMAKNSSRSVLLVEDHQELAETVGSYLEATNYIVDYASDGLTAMHLGVTNTYDAIVLDIMLPGVDGLTVCQRLRDDAAVTTPIIMLTARDQLDDKLKGFESGADDYLIKPFDMPELEARLDAVIRRSQHLEKQYEVSGLKLNLDTMEVVRDGQNLLLSRTLFNILHVLIRESPKVVTRAALEKELWGDEPPDSDTLRSHIYNLRRIIDRPFELPLLQTRQGQGYCLREPVPE